MSGANDRPRALVPAPIDRHATCLLMKVGQVVFRLAEDALAAHGLRSRHYSILQILDDAGPRAQQDLGAVLRIDAATMVASLDDLERLGFARRTRAEHDRRQYLVGVTAAGRRVLATLNDALDELDSTLLGDLAASDRDDLTRLLRGLAGGEILPAAFDALRGV